MKLPKTIVWLIEIFCKAEYLEDIIGDLEEEYIRYKSSHNAISLTIFIWREVLSLIFSYALVKRKKDHAYHYYAISQNSFPMIKSYLNLAVRNLTKQKLLALVNVLGLSAGMSIGILFITLIAFVKTYDNFHENKSNIYRIITKTDDKVKVAHMASSPAPLASLLLNDYSGFGKVVRINKSLKAEAKFGQKEVPISGFFVDENFLDVFTFDLLAGDNSLKEPRGILLTQSFATKLFSEDEALGQNIDLGKLGQFTVTGILKDIPSNSHMWFEVLVPYQGYTQLAESGQIITNIDDWKDFHGNYTYLLLPDESNVEDLTATLNQISQIKYRDFEQFDASFKIQELSEVALGSDTKDELGTSWGTEIYLMGLSLTLLILIPACFNYANISTARALSRAKEIGLRKVVGGTKKQIITQFLLETIVVSLISLAGAYFIFMVIRTEFQSMLTSGAFMDFTITPINLLYSVLFAIFTGLLAGIFPAVHFAGIQPINALKNMSKASLVSKANMQKVLLVVQFSLSFGFIMGVVVFADQYYSTKNFDLGFNKENILDIDLQGADSELVRVKIGQLASVQRVSMSSDIIGVNTNEKIWIPSNDDSIEVAQMFVDHNYLDNLDLKLVVGKAFDSHISQNEHIVIVNEQFTKAYGFENPNEALGEPIQINDTTDLRIVGVMQDFHFQNLSKRIDPLIFRSNRNYYNYANVRIVSGNIIRAFTEIENEWKKLSSAKLEAKFFADEIEDTFDIYTNVVKIFFFLGFLAITISCLGLLSMVVFSTQNRVKEVGIRKVMGAPVLSITYLLTKDYFKLMIIGSVISIPISYTLFTILISQQNAYSTGIGFLPVIVSFIIMLVLGLATVISETWKAATTNPVDTLRYE